MAAKNPPLEKQSSVVFEALAKRLHRLETQYWEESTKGKKKFLHMNVSYRGHLTIPTFSCKIISYSRLYFHEGGLEHSPKCFHFMLLFSNQSDFT